MNKFLFACAFVVLGGGLCAAQLADFPFDRELLLEAQPMRPGKRMPSLTIESNGRATIDLWCRSLPGRVELGAGTIAIVPAVSPSELAQTPLPAMQSAGQCTEPRIAADEELLASLAGAAQWKFERDTVVIDAASRPLKFRPAGN
jgi:heat shock protein HslJ